MSSPLTDLIFSPLITLLKRQGVLFNLSHLITDPKILEREYE